MTKNFSFISGKIALESSTPHLPIVDISVFRVDEVTPGGSDYFGWSINYTLSKDRRRLQGEA